MFENAEWIALKAGHNGKWFGTAFENEDTRLWHGDPCYAHQEAGSVIFFKSVTLREKPAKADLNICGLGFYEVWINGQKPDERRMLTPQVSDYFRYTRYDRYEIASLLKEGENTLAVEVCGGWFTGKEKFWGWQQIFYGNPRLVLALDGRYADGEGFRLATDRSWRVAHGAVTRSCIYDGEDVDLNLLPKDWMIKGEGVVWQTPVLAEAPTEVLIPDDLPPVRVTKCCDPVDSWTLSDTERVFDFGENGSAVPYLIVKGKKGDRIILNVSEFIFPDGRLNELSETGGNSENTDRFTLTGQEDICTVRFTWHGYRYMKLTLSNPAIEVIRVEKRELHSDIKTTGHFTCSSQALNRLHSAYVQTQISCLMGEPLDCNQRGERKGWTGDAAVSAEEAIYNFDMEALYAAFLRDLRLERHPGRKTFGIICPNHKSIFDGTSIDWAIAFPILMTESYARYGKPEVLRDNWEALKDYTAYYDTLRLPDGRLPEHYLDSFTGQEVSPAWFGDWCSVDAEADTERVAFDCGHENHRQNPGFLGSVFYAWLMRLTLQVAEALGERETADRYRALREETVQGIRQHHYHPETHTLGSGGQFLSTIALSEGIVPEEERPAAFEVLLKSFEEKGYHAYMGIYGQRLIGEVLRAFGREDVLYRIMTQPGYPGFMHMIEEGQTTIAESLTGLNNDIWGSGCHCMFAAADANLHRIFGGITVNRFREPSVILAPCCPEGLDYAEAGQKLREGEVFLRWERTPDGISYTVRLPEGLVAALRLPGEEERILKAGEHRIETGR